MDDMDVMQWSKSTKTLNNNRRKKGVNRCWTNERKRIIENLCNRQEKNLPTQEQPKKTGSNNILHIRNFVSLRSYTSVDLVLVIARWTAWVETALSVTVRSSQKIWRIDAGCSLKERQNMSCLVDENQSYHSWKMRWNFIKFSDSMQEKRANLQIYWRQVSVFLQQSSTPNSD